MTTPTAFPDPRVLLKRYGLAAKKSWGQNFLISESVYRAVVDATVREPDDWVVEIGAGLGTLTMRLAQRVPEGKVIAVERDRDMVAVLEAELGHLDNVEVHPANAMTYDLAQVARWRGAPVALCGNLPYQIASQLLFHFIDARQHLTCAVVMLQKEMAERLVAKPGTAEYGALGVLIGAYADIELVARARAGCFAPPPKVDSAVVRITPLAEPHVTPEDEHPFRVLVQSAFGMRRKQMRRVVRTLYSLDAEQADVVLARAGIDGEVRPEVLSVEQFVGLMRAR